MCNPLWHVYLDVLLRNQLASQIAPVLSIMKNAVNITAEVLNMKKATSAQTPNRIANAAGKQNEASSQRFASNKAIVLHIQTTSMVTGQRSIKAKALTSSAASGSFPVMVTPTPNQTRLNSNDPKANARSARTVKRSCPVRTELRLFAAWNMNG